MNTCYRLLLKIGAKSTLYVPTHILQPTEIASEIKNGIAKIADSYSFTSVQKINAITKKLYTKIKLIIVARIFLLQNFKISLNEFIFLITLLLSNK